MKDFYSITTCLNKMGFFLLLYLFVRLCPVKLKGYKEPFILIQPN